VGVPLNTHELLIFTPAMVGAIEQVVGVPPEILGDVFAIV
jgi:hypothetical protein